MIGFTEMENKTLFPSIKLRWVLLRGNIQRWIPRPEDVLLWVQEAAHERVKIIDEEVAQAQVVYWQVLVSLRYTGNSSIIWSVWEHSKRWEDFQDGWLNTLPKPHWNDTRNIISCKNNSWQNSETRKCIISRLRTVRNSLKIYEIKLAYNPQNRRNWKPREMKRRHVLKLRCFCFLFFKRNSSSSPRSEVADAQEKIGLWSATGHFKYYKMAAPESQSQWSCLVFATKIKPWIELSWWKWRLSCRKFSEWALGPEKYNKWGL